jgi:DNA-binding CsgD family transcriptional regulator
MIELIDRIYEAALIPELWRSILDDLSMITNCYGGTLFSMDAKQEVRQIVTEQYQQVMDIFVRDGWNTSNIRAERLAKIKYPGFVTDLDILSIEEINAHPFYTELLRPNGGGWAIGTMIPIPSGDILVFNLERRHSEGPVEKALCARLDHLRPHLARAGLLSIRLRMQRANEMVETLERVGLPAAVLRENGQAIAMNQLFQGLDKQITTGAFNAVTIVNASSDTLLKQALQTVRSNVGKHEARSIPIPATDDHPALIAHILPVKGSAHDIFLRACTILVVTSLHGPTAPSEDVLSGLFDLSPAEAKVALGIVGRKTLDELASDLALSKETLRSQLKSVFAKTGTKRQAELVGLLAGSSLRSR